MGGSAGAGALDSISSGGAVYRSVRSSSTNGHVSLVDDLCLLANNRLCAPDDRCPLASELLFRTKAIFSSVAPLFQSAEDPLSSAAGLCRWGVARSSLDDVRRPLANDRASPTKGLCR